tara:strand:+ start:29474 stop:29749 length:276 start_codon:yes stop_codon:yes gene_type:complete
MATSKKTTKAETVAAHGHAELEAKVAGLEKLVAELKKELKEHCAKSEKEHKALADKCDACCEAKVSASAADPRVDAMWKWLRKDRIFRSEN